MCRSVLCLYKLTVNFFCATASHSGGFKGMWSGYILPVCSNGNPLHMEEELLEFRLYMDSYIVMWLFGQGLEGKRLIDFDEEV